MTTTVDAPEQGVCLAAPDGPWQPYADFETELEQTCKHVKESVSRASSAIIERWARQAFEHKQPLAQALGLDPQTQRRQFLVPASAEAQSCAYFNHLSCFLRSYVLSDTPTSQLETCLVENSISLDEKRTMRFSRYLTRLITPEVREKWEAFKQWSAHPAVRDSKSLESLLSQFFESVSACRSTVIVTTNPLDLLLASEFGNFDSCFRFEGCHANGAIAVGNDDFTAMALLTQELEFPFNKRARAFLYAPTQANGVRDRLVIGNAYGTISDGQLRALSDQLSTSLALSQGLTNQWKAAIGPKGHGEPSHPLYYTENLLGNCGGRTVDDAHERFAVWFDADVERVVVHASLLGESDKVAQFRPHLAFADATCFQCGNETAFHEGLRCHTCQGRACHYCRGPVLGDEPTTVEDDYVCEDCYSRHTSVCDNCGERVHDENLSDQVSGVCQSCVDSDYTCCSVCEQYTKNDDIEHFEGDAYCDSCYGDTIVVCDCCDEQVHERNMSAVVNGVCDECEAKYYSTCTACGDSAKTSDMVESNGERYCDDACVSTD